MLHTFTQGRRAAPAGGTELHGFGTRWPAMTSGCKASARHRRPGRTSSSGRRRSCTAYAHAVAGVSTGWERREAPTGGVEQHAFGRSAHAYTAACPFPWLRRVRRRTDEQAKPRMDWLCLILLTRNKGNLDMLNGRNSNSEGNGIKANGVNFGWY